MSTETPTPETAAGGAARRQTAVMRRLAKIREHKDFPSALEYVPPAEEDLERAERRMRLGTVALVLGAAFLVLGVLDVLGPVVSTLFGLAGLATGGHFLFHGWKLKQRTLADPLVRVCALVADRRSETTPTWLGGRTVYYFALQLEDGTSGEYRYPGRGTQDDLLVKGLTGVAYLRGQTLLAWKNVRV